MKRLSTLLWAVVMTLCSIQGSYGQSYWKNSLFQASFDGLTALPSGMSNGRGGALAGTNSSARGTTVANDMMNITTGGSGGRGEQYTFPVAQKDLLSVDFDLRINAVALTENTHTFMIHLMGSNATGASSSANTVDGLGIISCVYLCGLDGLWHVYGQNVGELVLTPVNSVSPTLDWQTHMGTSVVYAAEVWYHFEYIMDYTTKRTTITITQKDNSENKQTVELPFISDGAFDFKYINIANTRPANPNSDIKANVDNIQISELVPSIGKADVIVHYQDLAGNKIKDDVTFKDQEVGLNFTITQEDKATFTKDGFYYAYDAAATGNDYVEVVAAGSEITVKYKKAAITTGTYIWKGADSEFWNEVAENFTVGSNKIAYQNGNPVMFSDPTAPKEITINGDMTLGEGNNMIIDAEGYSIVGTGSIAGTGKIIVNASALLGFHSKLPEALELNAGTLEVTDVNLAQKYIIDAAATLKLSAISDFNREVVVVGNAFNLEANQNSYPYSLKLSGDNLEAVNINLLQLGQTKTPTWPNNFSASTFPAGAKVNVTTSLEGQAVFAFGPANLEHCTLTLGDNIRAFNYYNNEAKGARLKFGALNGSETSTLEGGFVDEAARIVAYEVGGLNTDATFAGTIMNYGTVTLAPINLYKIGTGTWTLTGNSVFTTQGIYVNGGTLKVEGKLGDAANIPTVTVDAGATLTGSGTIEALQTAINGTLTGGLTLGGSLSFLDGSIAIINVDGASINKITTAGDIYYGSDDENVAVVGSTLKIVMQNRPTTTGVFKIFESGSNYTEGNFKNFEFPEPATDWSFNPFSGELTYTGETGSGIAPIDYSKEIASMEYYDVTGRQVSKDCKGLVVIKVKYTDGTTGVSKIFNK